MILLSFFWKIFDESGPILVTLPSALLSKSTATFGHESIKNHTRTRLTTPFMNAPSNPRYIAYLYNQIVKLSITHSGTRIVLNKGLTTNENGNLGLQDMNDSSLQSSIDRKQMVKNLCCSCK